MTKAQGKAEFRYFLPPELKAAAMKKAKANGWTLTYVLDRFLLEWTAPPAPPEPPAKTAVIRHK